MRRYGQYEPGEPSNLVAGKGRVQLAVYIGALPEETRLATRHEWKLVDQVEQHIKELEKRARLSLGPLGWVRLLKSLPGVSDILSATIYLEIGEVRRFAQAKHSASYAGLVSTVNARGGKVGFGPTSPMVNRYLRWAFVEEANAIVMHQNKYADTHVGQLYARLRAAKNHNNAVVTVAGHLAEAAWWMLSKQQECRAPAPATRASCENG